MATRLNPYISFETQARAAMEFYRGVFGGTLTMNTFGEFGMDDPAVANGVMHAMLETPGGMVLMASDTPPGMESSLGSAITISLSGDDEAELRGYWDGLCAGATIGMPLEKQMWGDLYGQLTDQYGIAWMVNIAAAGA